MDRNQIIKSYLKSIENISDQEYQKRVWIKAQGPECSDFDEFINYFFHESRSILNDYKKYGITHNQYKILKKFHQAFDNFCDTNDYPEEFIESSEWKKIMDMAQIVLNAFNYKKTS